MANALEVVTAAAKLVQLIGAREPLNLEDANWGLELLNDYLAGLNARGGFYAGGTLELGDTVPIGDDLLGSLKMALGKSFATGFQLSLGENMRSVMEADLKMVNATARVNIIQPDRLLQGMGS